MNVKNYEGSDILLYALANKLAFHRFMDTSHKYNILDSETKDSVLVKTRAIARRTSICLLLDP